MRRSVDIDGWRIYALWDLLLSLLIFLLSQILFVREIFMNEFYIYTYVRPKNNSEENFGYKHTILTPNACDPTVSIFRLLLTRVFYYRFSHTQGGGTTVAAF